MPEFFERAEALAERLSDALGKSFSLGGVRVSAGSVLVVLGLCLGLLMIILEAKRQKDDPNTYVGALIMAVIGGVLGARLYYMVFSGGFSAGMTPAAFFDIRSGGMAIYGGIFGGLLVLWIYSLICRHSLGKLADTLGIGFLIAQVIGEVCYIRTERLFLYEAVWCLILFFSFLVLIRRKRYEGEIFLKYMVCFSAGRILLEWFREDKLYIPKTEIPVTFAAAILTFVICLTMAITRGVMAGRRKELSKKRREARYAERDTQPGGEKTEEMSEKASGEIKEDKN